MKFEPKESNLVDKNTEITSLFDKEDANFDAVISKVDGYHPEEGEKVINEESERAYYVLEGEGTIYVRDNDFSVSSGDLIFIEKGKGHALEGDIRTLVITSPPFNPENERIE
ncbi:MAG: cupin domain-containing protein [Candidatus Nanohaloarchaea archaeon]